jgi:hypothetical protein
MVLATLCVDHMPCIVGERLNNEFGCTPAHARVLRDEVPAIRLTLGEPDSLIRIKKGGMYPLDDSLQGRE